MKFSSFDPIPDLPISSGYDKGLKILAPSLGPLVIQGLSVHPCETADT